MLEDTGEVYEIQYETYHAFKRVAFATNRNDAVRIRDGLARLKHVTKIGEVERIKGE